MNRGRGALAVTALACAWLVFLVPAAAFVPTGSEQTSGSAEVATTTLLQSDGVWALVVVAIPALLGLATWLGLHRRCSGHARHTELLVWVPIGLLYVFSFVSGFSIGLFVLPAALALGFAGAITRAAAPSADP
jgi:hypothetical protein